MTKRVGSAVEPFLVGQNPQRRKEIEAQLFKDFAPKDVLEEIWLSDRAVLTATIEYYRQLEAAIVVELPGAGQRIVCRQGRTGEPDEEPGPRQEHASHTADGSTAESDAKPLKSSRLVAAVERFGTMPPDDRAPGNSARCTLAVAAGRRCGRDASDRSRRRPRRCRSAS